MTALDISADNPLRPADWRWQRAKEIFSGQGLPTTRRRDSPTGYKWISLAKRFLVSLNRCRSEREQALLAEECPAIFWAHRAWVSETSPQKYSIEAHILAREDNDTIGYRTNMHPSYIEAYEALFFNVRDKLQHKQYILNCVMGPAIHRPFSEREYALLWKLYAYFLGPHVLDALESKFSNPVWCGTPEAVGAAILDDAIGTLKLKAAVAAKTVPVNAQTQLALMDQFTKFVEVERNSDDSGKSQQQLLEHVRVMLNVMPVALGGPTNQKAEGHIKVYGNLAAETTYEETLQIAMSGVPQADKTIRSLTFPVTQDTQKV